MSPAAPRDRVPPRTLPVLYVALAHAALALAFLLLALEPGRFMGFFYHPRIIAVVHLVTLGWITATTLGLTYVVGPLALAVTVRAGRRDTVAFAFFALGVSGIVTHFWIGGYGGVAWAGGLVLPAFVMVAVRLLRGLAGGGAPLAVRAHLACAYGNLLLAAALGILLAANKSSSFLPGSHLPYVYAHVHLAAAGWAALMVMGVGYRLFSILFPAAPPPGAAMWATLVLFETGLLGLAASLMAQRGGVAPFAVLMALGLLVFLATVANMRRHPMPRNPKLRRPDWGVLHVAQALLYLAATVVVGLSLAFSGETRPERMMVYGVVGLVGFLAQMIAGVEMRLLPMFAFTRAFADTGHRVWPRPSHEMPLRPLQAVSLAAWTAGVPLLAFGLGADRRGAVVAGACALLLGTVAAGASSARVLGHLYRRPR